MESSKLLIIFVCIFISTITAIPCPGLRVGTTSTGSDIALGGVVSGEWNQTNGHRLNAWDFLLDFYVSIDYTIAPPDFMQAVQVSQEVFLYSYSVEIIGGSGTIEKSIPEVFSLLHFRCFWKNTDMAFTRVNITIAPYDDIYFYFTKPCILPELNIGTWMGKADIIDNTTVSKNVSLVSPEREDITIYSMWLSPSTRVNQLFFDFQEVDSDMSIVSVGIQSTKPDEYLNSTYTNGLELRWNCLTLTEKVTSVRILIDIYFDKMLEFNVTKSCPSKAGPPGAPGWSTTAIFFFSVFLIIVVFCVAGCGYNFVKNEKTGCDVVPGATYYRACYEKIFPPKRYTPQMDTYDSTTTSSSGGAKSYGSTGYQENL